MQFPKFQDSTILGSIFQYFTKKNSILGFPNFVLKFQDFPGFPDDGHSVFTPRKKFWNLRKNNTPTITLNSFINNESVINA